MKNHRTSTRAKQWFLAHRRLCGAAILVGCLGVIATLSSRALTPSFALEAEVGTAQAPAVVLTDSEASAGKAIRFGVSAEASSLYGMTVDSVDNTAAIVAAAQASPRKLTTRIVFDEGTVPADYANAIDALHPHSYIMGELLDSEGLKRITAPQYQDRATQFVAAFKDKVDIWEIGNEVNGNWTGNYAEVGAKISTAYNVVKNAGKKTALTLYYDIDCGNGPSELDPIAFSNTYVPASMKQGLDYVFLSYYEADCNNIRPSTATWQAYYDKLHTLFPNAKLGFGEVGLPKAATSSSVTGAQQLLNYYYGLSISTPGYVGGYFWWYAYQDFLPVSANKPLWQAFTAVVQKY